MVESVEGEDTSTECHLCSGAGKCVRTVMLLDSVERIMKSLMRKGGSVTEDTLRQWIKEKEQLCSRYPRR